MSIFLTLVISFFSILFSIDADHNYRDDHDRCQSEMPGCENKGSCQKEGHQPKELPKNKKILE